MRRYWIGALAGAGVLAIAGIAVAGTKGDVTFETKYSTTKPGKSTGFKTSIEGAPRDAQGRLDPAKRVVVAFQPGTRFDTSVPARCTKETLNGEEGLNGCPKDSIVGTGTAEAISGLTFLDPIEEKITAVNTKNGILFYLTGLQKLVLDGKLKGNRLTVDVPPLPIPGNPKGAVLTKFDLDVKPVRDGRDVYVRTPPICRGSWKVRATFLYANVPAVSGVASTTRCSRR